MIGTLDHMKPLLITLAALLVGCGDSSGGHKEQPPPEPETVNLLVQSPSDASIWRLRYRPAGGEWTPTDPGDGYFVDANSVRSIADLPPGTYDFSFDLYLGPFSGFLAKLIEWVEVQPDERGDFLLVTTR